MVVMAKLELEQLEKYDFLPHSWSLTIGNEVRKFLSGNEMHVKV
jgi:hypothetical protein